VKYALAHALFYCRGWKLLYYGSLAIPAYAVLGAFAALQRRWANPKINCRWRRRQLDAGQRSRGMGIPFSTMKKREGGRLRVLHELEGLTKSRRSELIVVRQHGETFSRSRAGESVLRVAYLTPPRVLDLKLGLSELKASQKYLKFSDQAISLSLSVG
jgi:hypothetical protein